MALIKILISWGQFRRVYRRCMWAIKKTNVYLSRRTSMCQKISHCSEAVPSLCAEFSTSVLLSFSNDKFEVNHMKYWHTLLQRNNALCIDSTTCKEFNPSCLQMHSPGKKAECCGWLTVQYSFDTVKKDNLIWLFCSCFIPLFHFIIPHLAFLLLQYLPPGSITIIIQMYWQPMGLKQWGKTAGVFDYGVQDDS